MANATAKPSPRIASTPDDDDDQNQRKCYDSQERTSRNRKEKEHSLQN